MSLADPELALDKAQEFLAIINQDEAQFYSPHYGRTTADLRGMLPLMRDIVERVQPRLVANLEERTDPVYDDMGNYAWQWGRV